ncbi:Uu.00g095470.m01.CDS01 [Anthostomella pinea]|uniref:Uu.00g095470.m01.CDS01 n=1 Tax=Anthostomella pinea TaxID=933095 RepID=A0AAI8VC43_9PEZI|nr:Uu.00g095470.m01.CDS01 [Anthostomella pinea]
MDNDGSQFSYRQDNNELAVTSDNFFDQFVSFDSGDPSLMGGNPLENPPSPSILLDTIDSNLTNSSSNNQELHFKQFEVEGESAATSDYLTIPPYATIAEQSNSGPAVLTALAADPILNVGSVSGSELLRLEGISLQSLKGNLTALPSLPFDNAKFLNPHKHNQFRESVHATTQHVAHYPKPQRPGQTNITAMGAFQGDMRPYYKLESLDINDYNRDILDMEQAPIDSNDLLLSPLSTGKIPEEHQSRNMRFVSGHLDDPFSKDILAPPAVLNPAKNHNTDTPINTPIINRDLFYQHPIASLDMYTSPYQQQPKQQRSTSSAEWSMEGLFNSKDADDANLLYSSSPSAAYIPDSGNMPSPRWWETHHADTTHNGDAAHSDHNTHYTNGAHSNNASLKVSMYNQQQTELPHEYNTELSGQASRFSLATPRSSHHYHNRHSERRPLPRAPSSGARHRGSLTSPRKLHRSRAYLREESTSPTPHARPPGLGLGQGQQRSHSSSVRKRRPRTPTSKSGGFGSIGGGGGMGMGGGGSGIEFVNFTLSDKDMLMAGVAPSGSSTTRTRREKEAMEKGRKMSEAALKAVRAAGGDINRLVEEGFVM